MDMNEEITQNIYFASQLTTFEQNKTWARLTGTDNVGKRRAVRHLAPATQREEEDDKKIGNCKNSDEG